MNEWELLCRLTAPGIPDEPPTIPEEIDWYRLVELADDHHVLHQFGNGLADLDGVPEAVRSSVRARRRERATESLRMTNALCSVHEMLRAESIRTLAYKGPVLSALAYDDVAARQYVDLDLVVDPAAFDPARDALESAGFRPVERLRGLGEVALRDDSGIEVDLHRSVLPRYLPASLEFGDLWERRRSVSVGGGKLPTLGPTDTLLVSSVHGTKHCWYRLAWLRDVAAVVPDGQFDRGPLRERATDLRCLRHVLVALWLANRAYDVVLPDWAVGAIADDPEVERIGEWMERRLRDLDPSPPTDGEQIRIQWRALDRRTDRLLYAIRLATIPSQDDLDSVTLPRRFDPLYRAVRPARLAVRYGRDGCRQLFSEIR